MAAHSSNFKYHESAVIGEWSTLREPIHFAKDQVGNFGGGESVMRFNQFFQPLGSEELTFAVHGFGNAVRMKNNDVAGIESDAPVVVVGLFKDAERESGEFDFAATASSVKKRL